MNDKLLLLAFYAAGGLLLAALSVPLLLGKVRPNGRYGFRVPKTLENPDAWYAVNRYAARRLLAAGIGVAAAALALYLFPGLSLDAYALLCLAVFALVFIAGLIQSFRYLRSL